MPFRRWLPNVLLALAVAAVISTFPPVARAQECPSVEALSDIAGKLEIFRILQGGKALRAIAAFNALPPETDAPWTSAFFLIRPDGFGVLMVGIDGTICEGIVIAPDGVEEFLRLIDGLGI